jgi:hypothetical protein
MLLDQMVTKACDAQQLARSDYRFSRQRGRDASFLSTRLHKYGDVSKSGLARRDEA